MTIRQYIKDVAIGTASGVLIGLGLLGLLQIAGLA